MQVYFKKIDFIFYNERKIRRIVKETRIDSVKPEIKNGSGLSDPTASAAIRNLSPLPAITVCGETLKFPESWLAVIDKTYSWCKRQSLTHFESVRRKYLGEHYLSICRLLHISPATFNNLIHRARQYAALQAVQFRLLFIQ